MMRLTLPLLLSLPLAAQQWVDRTSCMATENTVHTRGGPDGNALIFRHGLAFTWDGDGWREFTTVPTGFPWLGTAAFDPVSNKTFALTGSGAWEFDASGWTQLTTATIPTPYIGWQHTLIHDPATNRIVAMSEFDPAYQTQDWAWNGTAWVPLPTRPFSNSLQVCADPVRGELIAITDTWQNHTYVWDGVSWNAAANPNPFPRRRHAAMAFDDSSGRVTLYGGFNFSTALTDMWQWDGTTWTQVPLSGATPTTDRPHMFFDRRHEELTLIEAGYSKSAEYRFDGSGWQTLAIQPPALDTINFYQAATDPVRGQLVLRSDGKTYEWDGTDWGVSLAPGPSTRNSPLAFDPSLAEVVMFGGDDTLGNLLPANTWSWNGSTWTLHTPAVTPPPRRLHALVSAPALGGVILFGGLDANYNAMQDTWLWASGAWTDLTSTLPVQPNGGQARGADGGLGFDSVVVCDGQTWSFNVQWNLIATTAPIAFPVVGVRDSGAPLLIRSDGNTTLELAGGAWVSRGAAPNHIRQTANDPVGGDLIGIGRAGIFALSDTPASVQPLGGGCGAPVPQISTRGIPRIQSPGFEIEVGHVSSLAGVFADFAQANIPLSGGCFMQLSQPQAIGIGAANGFGFTSVPLPIPATLALRGLDLFVQAVALQASGPINGLAASDGMRLHLGH